MELKCQDCRNSFEFTDGERRFYENFKDEEGNPKPLSIPKRCKECRVKKKARIEGNGGYPNLQDDLEGRN